MQYQINPAVWNGVFAVPNEIVDKHIKLCGGISLKILLLLLRQGGNPTEPAQLAKHLNLPTVDVMDALGYWIESGVILAQEDDTKVQGDASISNACPSTLSTGDVSKTEPVLPHPSKTTEPSAGPSISSVQPQQGAVLTPSARPRFPREEVIALIHEDRVLKGLLQEIQAILGKTCTSVDMDVLVGLYSYYGLSAHYIVTLVHYCVSLGKRSMAYVEKTAASWMEEGIDDSMVDEHVDLLTRRRSNEGKIRSAFGIGDRRLVASEQRMISRWFETFGFSMEMILAAYERTVERTGKLAFKYLDAILESWYQKGYQTLDQIRAEQNEKEPAAKQKQMSKQQTQSDYDQLGRMVLDKFMKE